MQDSSHRAEELLDVKKSLGLAGPLRCQDSALLYVNFEDKHKGKKKSFISKNETHPTGSNANIYFPKPVLD